MPVILTSQEEIELWMTAPTEEALKLLRPLVNGALQIVARGMKKDGPLEGQAVTASDAQPAIPAPAVELRRFGRGSFVQPCCLDY